LNKHKKKGITDSNVSNSKAKIYSVDAKRDIGLKKAKLIQIVHV
jgi:hypothetical protein